MTALPIDEVLPQILAAVDAAGRAVIQAPPGAGKTTRVPLALLQSGDLDGRIILLEPRRVAARAAAERMAQTLGEAVGETVGYRIRGESKAGPATRIEVVTEGILTRMIQDAPDLPGVSAVIFDEFHERSLNADLGLALCLEVREALREDLVLIAMSATLDAAPVADLMGSAPIVTSEGRSYPVETRWRDRPAKLTRRDRIALTAETVKQVLTQEEGSVLVFLPGAGEIREVQGRLGGVSADIFPLYGALSFADQRRAIAPSSARRVVLATSIAETSLTIEGVRVVIDAGLARRARFDPRSGMSRLVTEPVTRAEADQRRGRAGRVEAGICYRLWSKGEEGALAAYPPAEIEATDLTALALELAVWGAETLPFLTPPPERALAEARDLLIRLGALDRQGRLTEHGRQMSGMPVHPRLAHMLIRGGPDALPLAALLSTRDPLRGVGAGRPPVDLSLRLATLRGARHADVANQAALGEARAEMRRLKRFARGASDLGPGATLSLAYPDRMALRRPGEAPRYHLSGGKGACVPDGDALAGQRMLVAADLSGEGAEPEIRLALTATEAELKAAHPDQLRWVELCLWSRRHRRIDARRRLMLGALILEDRGWPDATAEALAAAAMDGIRDLGLSCLGWTKPARLLQARIDWLRARGAAVPDMSNATLEETLEGWLAPFLAHIRTADDLARLDPLPALRGMLDWETAQTADRLAPERFVAPTGSRVAVDYSVDPPRIAIRLQELFGLDRHPTIGPENLPLLIDLLSPGQRVVQTTADLPGFWRSSYADVRKDMRGRYPRHPWPEDPTAADPTRRAKPRGT
ncbi:MAG: ATP-dependent helicase HrpB [Pseudomonadota bacterium]